MSEVRDPDWSPWAAPSRGSVRLPERPPTPVRFVQLPRAVQPGFFWLWVEAATRPPWLLVSGGPAVRGYSLLEFVARLAQVPSGHIRLLQGGEPLQEEPRLGNQLSAPVQVLQVEARGSLDEAFRPLMALPAFPTESSHLPLRLVPSLGIMEVLGTVHILSEEHVVLANPDGLIILSAMFWTESTTTGGRAVAPVNFRRLVNISRTSLPRSARRVAFADEVEALPPSAIQPQFNADAGSMSEPGR